MQKMYEHVTRPINYARFEALFWHDNWTGLGPLIVISGPNGPRVLGINTMSTVSETIRENSWLLPRGRHRIITLIKACLPAVPPTLTPETADVFLWRNNPNSESGRFIAAKTWSTLYPASSSVSWHKSIWFQAHIPKHAFLAWVVILNRLPTRDKLQQWGLNVAANCLLCDSSDEDRDHIFFRCVYSQEIMSTFFNHPSFTPPSDFAAVINWLPSASTNAKVKTICHLLVQAIAYVLWRERNSRYYTSVTKPYQVLVKEVKTLNESQVIRPRSSSKYTSCTVSFY